MKDIFLQTDILSTRFIKFCFVGAANTLVDFLVYSFGLWLGFSPYPSRTASSIAGCLFSFFVNKSWTFRAGDKGIAPLARFVVVNACVLCLGLVLLFLFKTAGCGNTLAYLASLPFTTIANYLGYRLWAFKNIR